MDEREGVRVHLGILLSGPAGTVVHLTWWTLMPAGGEPLD
jgi:hypothetical protein